ncbi:anaerobic ribonucleoside-triphosphate reductase [Ideonella sp. A 288]|uniref:anaerobic ribonucleoside-triphosphate reductase n=1 Tax=Ideonella sp. A 288 TaxID=1962181 RepID=UPI000B4B90E3|nr:anaerobic ribonucleoside-triphosphate reductase [Ideonella sp. A 288]
MTVCLSLPTHPLLADHERQRCEVWTRVMGYHRPMASFNIGKQGEFNQRRYFVEPGRAPTPQVDTEAPAPACA